MVATKPGYLEVAEALEAQVQALAPNSLLPTEQQLARRFHVSRVTVRRALGLLEQSGRVSRQRGRGTVVSPPKITRRIVPACPIEQDLREQGLKLETSVLEYQPSADPPEYVRTRLRLRAGESVGFLSLLRAVDDRVICHDRRYLPPALATRFDPRMLEGQPVSEFLQELAGKRITLVDWETDITPGPQEVARALGITPGVLVVTSTFTAYFDDGEPLEAGVMAYRIDRVRFRVVASGPLLTVGVPQRGTDAPGPSDHEPPAGPVEPRTGRAVV